MSDFYEILGLNKGATIDEVKKAYRQMARKYHPDVSKESGAEDRFKKINEAYQILSNPQKKQAYDSLGRRLLASRAVLAAILLARPVTINKGHLLIPTLLPDKHLILKTFLAAAALTFLICFLAAGLGGQREVVIYPTVSVLALAKRCVEWKKKYLLAAKS